MSQNSRSSKTRASRQKDRHIANGIRLLATSTNSAIRVSKSEFDRFVETARKLGCAEDKEHFEGSLGKIAEYKRPKKQKIKKEARK